MACSLSFSGTRHGTLTILLALCCCALIKDELEARFAWEQGSFFKFFIGSALALTKVLNQLSLGVRNKIASCLEGPEEEAAPNAEDVAARLATIKRLELFPVEVAFILLEVS